MTCETCGHSTHDGIRYVLRGDCADCRDCRLVRHLEREHSYDLTGSDVSADAMYALVTLHRELHTRESIRHTHERITGRI